MTEQISDTLRWRGGDYAMLDNPALVFEQDGIEPEAEVAADIRLAACVQGTDDHEAAEAGLSLCRAFRVTAEERASLQVKDDAAFAEARDAWADEAIEPMLVVPSFHLRYRAPLGLSGDGAALEAWAAQAAQLVWRDVVLVPNRRQWVRFDGLGTVRTRKC